MVPNPFLLGPPPPGDPLAMTAYASRLETIASDARTAAAKAQDALDEATFAGPAGAAARREASDLVARSGASARKLTALAEEIRASIGAVRDARAAWEADKRRLEAGQPLPFRHFR